MIDEIRPDVNTTSSEFKDGVEAGLNSADETNDKKPAGELGIPSTPLFMRSSPERVRGNAQDEKDATEE